MKQKWKKLKPEPAKPSAVPGRKVEAGDIVRRRPVTFSNPDSGTSGLIKGTVIYVHPKGRFHVVEFPGRLGAIREAFHGVIRYNRKAGK